MEGLVKYARGSGHVEVRDVAECELGEDEVRIEVEATGICGSDLHIFHDAIKIPIQVPVVMGHECSGRVVEVGPAVESIKLGARVTVMPSVGVCQRCRYCRTGDYNLCLERQSMGYWRDGSFASTCAVPERCVWMLPDNVDFRTGALSEPLACCVHAVCELTRVHAGDLVAIVGPGTIGLLCLQVVKAEGGVAVVCGRSQDGMRLQLARELGADYVVNVDEEDAAECVRGVSEGYGSDVVLECSGHVSGAALALELVRKQGRYTQVGLFGRPIEVDLEVVAYKELVFTGSLGQKPSAWRRSLGLMEMGKVDTGRLISGEFALEDWREAFAAFERQEGVKWMFDVKA